MVCIKSQPGLAAHPCSRLHPDNGDDNSLGPQVVCRQLGFTGGAQFFFPKNAALPAGNATVLTGALVCNGSEASLAGEIWAAHPHPAAADP